MIFLSYSSEHAFEAELLRFAYETMLGDLDCKVWDFKRDQPRDQKNIVQGLKEQVRQSKAFVFLVTPSTLDKGANQWTELAWADAYEIPTFVILHLLDDKDLSSHQNQSVLLSNHQHNPSSEWRNIAADIRNRLQSSPK